MDQIASSTPDEEILAGVGTSADVSEREWGLGDEDAVAASAMLRRFGRARAQAPPRLSVSVSVVIPTMNEAANLPHVLSQIPDDYEVIVVDGGSTDGTMEVARTLRPSAIVMRQSGHGKGDALFSGFAAAHGEIIVTLDGDGSQRASEIQNFIDALCGGADFAKGSRMLNDGGSADLTRLRGAGNWALGTAANILHGTTLTDITYGFNAFWRDCLPYVINDSSGFEGETIMCIRAARAGLKITEVACYEDRRIHGQSNLRTFRDGWRILSLLINERRADRETAMPQLALPIELASSAAERSA